MQNSSFLISKNEIKPPSALGSAAPKPAFFIVKSAIFQQEIRIPQQEIRILPLKADLSSTDVCVVRKIETWWRWNRRGLISIGDI